MLRAEGIAPERIKAFGFPVSPKFADAAKNRRLPLEESVPHVLYMINAGTRNAPNIVRRLLDLEIQLTVTVGHDERLRHAIETAAFGRALDIVGWTDQLPFMLCESHLLIGKAGGATVQETIAARCPMIINHMVSGQEEGNARLIMETNSGAVALSPNEVIAQVRNAFADDARQWREWEANISELSRPAPRSRSPAFSRSFNVNFSPRRECLHHLQFRGQHNQISVGPWNQSTLRRIVAERPRGIRRSHSDCFVQWCSDFANHRSDQINHPRGAASQRRSIAEKTSAVFD